MGMLGNQDHVNAIYWAGRNAQFAARAQLSDDSMSALAASNDGVHGACLDAQSAADTMLGVDLRNVPINGGSTCWVEGFCGFVQKGRQGLNCRLPTGRAAVQVSLIAGQRFCIRKAALKPALRALGLRQYIINLLNQQLMHCLR